MLKLAYSIGINPTANALSRILQNPSLGLGESYVLGEWEPVDDLITVFVRIFGKGLQRQHMSPIEHLVLFFAYSKANLWNRQSIERSKQVALQHYDLSTDMYKNMLQTMVYSCGFWDDIVSASNEALVMSQEAKMMRIAEKLGLSKKGYGESIRILDIGCGWGVFANFLAEHYQAEVVGITISEEQLNYCRLHAVEGTTFYLQDYRTYQPEVPFDHIVSVGMFEHVGSDNYDTYVRTCYRLLKEEGTMLLHTIGGQRRSKLGDPWIQKYIFPNSCLPTLGQITTATEKRHQSWVNKLTYGWFGEPGFPGFVVEDVENFGYDYYPTLMAWRTNFNKYVENSSLDKHQEPMFTRMWNYYLSCCAAMFKMREIQLYQILLSKGGIRGGWRGRH